MRTRGYRLPCKSNEFGGPLPGKCATFVHRLRVPNGSGHTAFATLAQNGGRKPEVWFARLTLARPASGSPPQGMARARARPAGLSYVAFSPMSGDSARGRGAGAAHLPAPMSQRAGPVHRRLRARRSATHWRTCVLRSVVHQSRTVRRSAVHRWLGVRRSVVHQRQGVRRSPEHQRLGARPSYVHRWSGARRSPVHR